MVYEERTEAATPRRREELRRRGQVARSPDLVSAAVLLAGLLALRFMGEELLRQTADLSQQLWRDLHQPDLTPATVGRLSGLLVPWLVQVLGPLMAVLAAVGLLANLVQTGLLITWSPLAPDLNRINPVQGLRRLLSWRALVDLVRATLKLAVVSLVVYQTLRGRLEVLLLLPLQPLGSSLAQVWGLAWNLLLAAAGALLALAVLDYGYQRWSYERSIRMTREEVREELKQTEGHPLIRQRIRQLQRAVARRRMMAAVPRAQVVITNPVHLAVALQYLLGQMRAPRVVAKGERLLAEQIKQVARAHGVPVVENPPLAQALYRTVEVGQEIPPALYQAVAEVLAFILRLRGTLPTSPSTRL